MIKVITEQFPKLVLKVSVNELKTRGNPATELAMISDVRSDTISKYFFLYTYNEKRLQFFYKQKRVGIDIHNLFVSWD